MSQKLRKGGRASTGPIVIFRRQDDIDIDDRMRETRRIECGTRVLIARRQELSLISEATFPVNFRYVLVRREPTA